MLLLLLLLLLLIVLADGVPFAVVIAFVVADAPIVPTPFRNDVADAVVVDFVVIDKCL